jgi:hypothetical protein
MVKGCWAEAGKAVTTTKAARNASFDFIIGGTSWADVVERGTVLELRSPRGRRKLNTKINEILCGFCIEAWAR